MAYSIRAMHHHHGEKTVEGVPVPAEGHRAQEGGQPKTFRSAVVQVAMRIDTSRVDEDQG